MEMMESTGHGMLQWTGDALPLLTFFFLLLLVCRRWNESGSGNHCGMTLGPATLLRQEVVPLCVATFVWICWLARPPINASSSRRTGESHLSSPGLVLTSSPKIPLFGSWDEREGGNVPQPSLMYLDLGVSSRRVAAQRA